MKQIKQNKISSESGSALIEIIITLGIVVVMISATINLILASTSLKYQVKQKNHATIVAKEIVEITSQIKNNDWQNIYSLINQGNFHPVKNGSVWQLQAGEQSQDGFTSYIIVSEVKKDGGLISETNGTIDTETVKITTTVKWQSKNKNKQLNFNSYMTDWQN